MGGWAQQAATAVNTCKVLGLLKKNTLCWLPAPHTQVCVCEGGEPAAALPRPAESARLSVVGSGPMWMPG